VRHAHSTECNGKPHNQAQKLGVFILWGLAVLNPNIWPYRVSTLSAFLHLNFGAGKCGDKGGLVGSHCVTELGQILNVKLNDI
jgi:hypothetical protein